MGYQMKYFSIRLTQLHSVKLRVELIVLIYPDPPVIQRLSFTSSRNLFSGQHKLPPRYVYLYFRNKVHCTENEILTEKNVGNDNCVVTENV